MNAPNGWKNMNDSSTTEVLLFDNDSIRLDENKSL